MYCEVDEVSSCKYIGPDGKRGNLVLLVRTILND